MADRLITRDRTKEYLKRVIQQDIFKSKAWFRGETTIDAWVDAIPGYDTGDLVPVVRCKDCMFGEDRYVDVFCSYYRCYRTKDFYCASGAQRKEGKKK